MAWTYLDSPSPFGMAHRGGDSGGPENTLASFARAVELGYQYLETDVHLSADGVLVAFHDDDLTRLVGHPTMIGELTWDEIKQIELEGGHRIPRLEMLLDAFPQSRFNIDPKSNAAVDPLAKTIEQYKIVDQVCIGSFEQARIDRVRELLGPDLCTSPAPPEALKVVAAALFWPRWRSPYGCLQIPPVWNGLRLANSWLIQRIQQLGMQVHFWTINETDEMHRILDAGANAIITDNVHGLNEVLNERSDASSGPIREV